MSTCPYRQEDVDMVARWLRMRAQAAAEHRTGRSTRPHRLLSWPVATDLAVAVLRVLDKADDAAWRAWRAGLDYMAGDTATTASCATCGRPGGHTAYIEEAGPVALPCPAADDAASPKVGRARRTNGGDRG